jgi:hypothetical protein
MAELLAGEKRKKRAAAARIFVKRIAAAAAALFVVFGGLLFTAPEIRAAAAGVIVKWFDGFTRFGPDNPATGDAVSPDWRPAFIPDGFSEASNTKTDGIISIRYADGQGGLITFICVPNDNSLSVNNENAAYSQVLRGDIVYHTFTSASPEYQSAAVWDADGYLFTVSAYLPMERILEVAWSVR